MPLRNRTPDTTTELTTQARSGDRNAGTTTELDSATERVVGELREGLLHGFFDYSMSCEVVRGGKRRFTLRAGKSHRFVIPEKEIQ